MRNYRLRYIVTRVLLVEGFGTKDVVFGPGKDRTPLEKAGKVALSPVVLNVPKGQLRATACGAPGKGL